MTLQRLYHLYQRLIVLLLPWRHPPQHTNISPRPRLAHHLAKTNFNRPRSYSHLTSRLELYGSRLRSEEPKRGTQLPHMRLWIVEPSWKMTVYHQQDSEATAAPPVYSEILTTHCLIPTVTHFVGRDLTRFTILDYTGNMKYTAQ